MEEKGTPIHHFTITYTADGLRRCVDRFMWRRLREGFGWTGLLAIIACGTSLVLLLVHGDRSWIVGVLASFLALFCLFVASVWVWRRREAHVALSAIPSRKAEVTLTDETITITAASGATTIPWAYVSEMWTFPDALLIFLRPNAYVTVPTAGVPTEALAFIHARVTSK